MTVRVIDRWLPSGVATRWFEPLSGEVMHNVVVVPSVGYAEVVARTAWRTFAELAAPRGICVVLIDPIGTGLSAGTQLSVPAWSDAIKEVASVLDTPFTLMGARLGALFSLHGIADPHINELVTSLVLWSPTVSGKRFRRELTLLCASFPHSVDDDGLTFGGFHYPSDFLTEVSLLSSIATPDGTGRSLLVIAEPNRKVESELVQHFETANWHARVIESDAMQPWLDTSSELSRVPHAAMQSAIEFLSQQKQTIRKSSGGQRDLSTQKDGRTLGALGEPELASLLCTPSRYASDHGVLFLNSGAERAIGPGRTWMDLSQEFVQAGIAVLHVDHASTGDSGTWQGQQARDVYGTRGCADIELGVQKLVDSGCKRVVIVGLCSSAYSSIEFGPDQRVSDIIAINPQLYRIGTPAGVIEEATNMTRYRLARIDNRLHLRRRAKTVLSLFGRRHPAYGWLAAFDKSETRLSPIFGTLDRGLRFLDREDHRQFVRLMQSAQINLQTFDGVDHALHNRAQRDLVLDVVRSIVYNRIR